jgi:hypothetical protein
VSRADDLARAIREGDRAKRELERLSALPDFDAYEDGTIVVVTLVFVRDPSQPYVYVGYKSGGRWSFTGRQAVDRPHNATGAQVAEWLAKSGRRVVSVDPLAVYQVSQIPVVDLTEALGAMLASLQPAAARRPYSGEYPDGVFPSGGSYGD